MTDLRAESRDVLAGGGELGALMRAMDWSKTPLGPVAGWPQSLRTCVRIMLTSRQPIWIGWGPQLTYLYNDAYKSIIGGKHPAALGQPTAVVWREIWDDIEPRLRAALGGQEGTYDEALLLIMERHGYPEETYYTFSYSPIPDDDGRVGGIFCANTDDTQRIIGERQLALLRELAAETADARTVEEACERSARCIATSSRDLPFALIYLLDRERNHVVLAGRSNLTTDHPAAPAAAALEAGSIWPFAEVVRTNTATLVAELPATLGAFPTGAWDRPPSQALALPIAAPGQTEPAGILIVGLNPYRLFDAAYQRFLELVSGQLAAAIANARAYEEERRRAEALAELDRAKTQFFSNVSHEFRTPLTLLLGPIEDALAEFDRTHPAEQRERLQVAHRNALRLLRLVNTLLDFSRIEAGRVQAAYELTDLPAATAELASAFRSAIERAGLGLILECPPLPAGIATYVDREMWEKIVFNLLSNALKFTLDGEIAVSVRATADGKAVQLVVRDTGTGIPEAELPRLFERFHRVQGTQARTHEGTGIGLALIQELVRLHGGSIAVASALDAGTIFTVEIPAGAAHLRPEQLGAGRQAAPTAASAAPYLEEALRWLPQAGEAAEPLPAGDDDESGVVRDDLAGLTTVPATRFPTPVSGRILLADDNADMRDYVTRLLSQRFEVEAVADGVAALAAAQARPPDLVLSDVMMPRLDGFGLLQALRADARTRDVPVILLSARAGEEARVEGLDAGADDYLIKPFAARELLARVGTHLALARMRAEALRREQAARAEAAEAERGRLQELFEQAPAAIAILSGPDHVYTLANPRYLRLVGRRDILGKPIRAALPELSGQDIFELLDRVYQTGEPFVGNEVPVQLRRDASDRLETVYFNFVYEPLKRGDGEIEGIFVHAVDITDQRRAQAALRESEQRLSAIFNQAAVGIAQTDLDGRFVLANERYAEIVGHPLAELLAGMRMQDITHSDDLPRNLELLGQMVRDGTDFAIEKRYVRPDSSHIWVRNSVSRVDGLDGEPCYILAISEDITARRLAEAALQASEDRYRRIFDTAAVSIWEEDASAAKALLDELKAQGVTDLGAYLDAHPDVLHRAVGLVRVVDVNEQSVRLFGAANKAELLTSLESVFLPETLPAFRDVLVAMSEGRRDLVAEAPHQALTGERRDLVFSIRFPEPGVPFDSVFVSLIDITEQHRAEAEARRVRLDLYEMIMQSPVPMCVVVGPDLVFELANPPYLEVAGGRDLVGKPLLEAMPELAGQGFDDFLREVMRSGESVTGEESRLLLERNGELQDTYWTFIYAPLRNSDGVIDRVMAICNEVTAQVRARLEREALLAAEQAARQTAEAAVRVRDEFLSIASHELRTPVTAIKGTAELALRARARGTLDLARAEQSIETINRSVARLVTLLNDLLDVSRLQGGQLALQTARLDLVALVRGTVERYAELLDSAHTLGADLPASPVLVNADAGRLEQVLDNLLHNAVKYSPDGGVIEVGLTPGRDGVALAVQDPGIGLPEGAAERIFEPFGRAANALAQKLPGLGLGLHISRRIVELHGGRLWAESAGEGRGTTMRLWLPAVPAREAATTTAQGPEIA